MPVAVGPAATTTADQEATGPAEVAATSLAGSPVRVNLRAGVFMMVAMAGYTINDFLVKTLDGAVPIGQILFVRGTLLVVAVFLLVWRTGLLPQLRVAMSRVLALRTVLELAAAVVFLVALPQLPFSSTSAILQSLPLAVTLGAAVFLGEPIGWRRIGAILIGFIGVLIIIQPGTDDFELASLWVVLAVVFAMGRDLSSRRLPAALPTLVVTLVTAAAVAVAGWGMRLVEADWVALDGHQWAVLAGSAVFLLVGYQFIVQAMRSGEVAYVVPFRYTGLLWAVALGWVFLDEVPRLTTLGGAAIVVAMGLFSLYRESLRARQATPPAD